MAPSTKNMHSTKNIYSIKEHTHDRVVSNIMRAGKKLKEIE